MAQFVMDTCEASPDAVESFSNLYGHYLGWVHDNKITQTLTTTMFSTRLQKLGYKNSHSGDVRTFRGLRLKQ